jgi:hypothetical protein
MAELTIITETGMFHSACRATWGNVVEWYGFKPKQHRTPHGEGLVDRSDRSAMLKHYITFDVQDGILRSALRKVADDYSTKTYTLSVCDCVSFSADVAREVGLRVPMVNITPYGFIEVLGFWNTYRDKK